MRIFIVLFCALFLFFGCKSETTNIDSFKTGKYKTLLKDNEISSIAVRNDSLQIELTNGVRDTFYINWKNDFEYTLLKKHPKSLLDSTPFHVKITGIKNNEYTFKAFFKGSNFKQEGTAIKLEE
ncbi:hypothetical protein [Namhaeicola litoreus]|uniref:DNA topoisomerase IV n=1 Tax=Namhaeicola litoreus TaxID=1052145 RepID=A0ABW3Y380_9FLAO